MRNSAQAQASRRSRSLKRVRAVVTAGAVAASLLVVLLGRGGREARTFQAAGALAGRGRLRKEPREEARPLRPVRRHLAQALLRPGRSARGPA